MKGQKSLTIVIKLGTSSIVDERTHEPLLSILSLIVETAIKLRKDGHRVVIVSSGAIGVGLRRMDIEKRPKHLPRIQALAAVGQCRLMSLWDSLFAHLQQPVAQILLTRNDIADRTQYLNAQNTFSELLSMGVIPIVNENDTIAVSEIKFGDNDTLSAITAAMVQADYLFLMTDVDCLYTSNPRTNPSALPIHVVDDPSTLTADVSTAGSSLGVGGMSTKIVAARLATSAGVMTVITRSSKPGNVADIIAHVQALKQAAAPKLNDFDTAATPEAIGTTDMLPIPPLHTRFMPSLQPIRSRSFWLLHGLSPRGTLYIDEGAHRALLNKAGLLPVGIVSLEGHFSQQEAVRLVVVRQPDHAAQTQSPTADAVKAHLTSSAASISAPSLNQAGSLPPTPTRARARVASINDRAGVAPVEIGRALVNYSAAEITRIKGLQSGEILAVLGYADSEYVALRENVSLLMTSGNATPTRELGEREVGDER